MQIVTHVTTKKTENNCVALGSNNKNLREVEPVNLKVHIGNIETKTMVYPPGSNCLKYHKIQQKFHLANAVVNGDNYSFWKKTPIMQDLKRHTNEVITIVGSVVVTVKTNH